MKTLNIENGYPSQKQARATLENYINSLDKTTKITKIIHGYGSSGVGGSIKKMVHSYLKRIKNEGIIKDYLPGEATKELMGFDQTISKYKPFIKDDIAFKQGNPGITYIFNF
jgi:DNA-nicking Smr family endonuclease